MRLYIAGPMSGLPEWNYPAFFNAESDLVAFGYKTLNPARNPKQDCWEDYMRAGIAQVIQADGIAYLPGSDRSRGALIELRLARDLGIPTKPLNEWINES